MTYTRSEILDTAKQYVNKDRAAQHGDMESNLTNHIPILEHTSWLPSPAT
jgi:hypothetical protein